MEFTGERHVPSKSDVLTEVEHEFRYRSVTRWIKDKIVLDAACGEGFGSNILAQRAKRVTGIDISKEAIEHAQQRYQSANLIFKQCSIVELDFEEQTFDTVVSFETIEHVTNEVQHEFLKGIKKILKHDGVLFISTPDKYWYSEVRDYQNPFHVHEFYKGEFRKFLEGYFRNVEFYYQKQELVSMLTNERSETMVIENEGAPNLLTEGKYIVAVCSDSSIQSLSLSSIEVSEKINFDSIKKDENEKIRQMAELHRQFEDKTLSISRAVQMEQLQFHIGIARDKQYVYIWGTGTAAERTYNTLAQNRCDIHGFIDNNVARWGSTFMNLPVYAPLILEKNGPVNCYVFIGTSYFNDVSEQLTELNMHKYENFSYGVVI